MKCQNLFLEKCRLLNFLPSVLSVTGSFRFCAVLFRVILPLLGAFGGLVFHYCDLLAFLTLCANSADDELMTIFLLFPENRT